MHHGTGDEHVRRTRHRRRRAAKRRSLIRVLAPLAGAAITVGGAACGSTASTVSSTHTASATSSTSSAAASSTTPAAATESGASAGSSSPAPGTTLPMGQTVTLPFDTTTSTGGNGPSYKLKVTVVSLKQGTLSDFNGIQLDSSEKASTPDYVRIAITNLGPGKINTENNDPTGAIEGVDHTGQPQDSVTFILGSFPPCPPATEPNPLAVGHTFRTCLTFLVPGGITKVAYTGTQSYYDTPLTWAPK